MYCYTEELYHFGVPGMRWGHRKPVTAKQYSRKIRKIRDLEERSKKRSARAAELNAKSAKSQASATRRFFNDEERQLRMIRQSNRERKRAAKAERGAMRAIRKGQRIYKRLQKRMVDADLSTFNKSDLEYGKAYAQRYLLL